VPPPSPLLPTSATTYPWPPAPGGTWVIDLDGVIWLTGIPLPGVDRAIEALHQADVRVVFATNNSAPTRAELHRRLANCGITATDDDLLSSAGVAASMLPEGSTALVLADEGVREALAKRHITVVEHGPADAVVVGWTHSFTFESIAAATSAVRSGARLIGTNEDPTHPTPEGLLPGTGALLAAVATASETQPEVAGKPHAPTAQAIAAMASDVRVMVGDRPSTDGALAEQLAVPFALVFSGVTAAGEQPIDPTPSVTSPDLATLVKTTLERQLN
jgi:glycerol 3-phosphatase-2